MDQARPFSKNEFLDQLLRPKRIAFIVNPKAGTNLQRNIEEGVDKHLNHRNFTHGFKYTERAGHAFELAKEATEEAYDIVVAVGGDGSINEVASALMDTETTLGIVPAGSGNGLAMHLGYGRDINEAIRKINFAEERVIDMGLLNDRPFINLAGIGFDGLVSNLMKGSNWRGFIPYFLKSIQAGLQYTPQECRIETEHGVLEAKCFAISVANGPMYGYNVKIAPDAILDDGFFEVVVLRDAPKWQYFAAVPATFSGKIYEADFVEHIHARKVVISSPGINHVHVDGEGMAVEGDLRFEIKPRCVKILVPKEYNENVQNNG
jgi:diacylglycerol kinase (ATP)